MRSSAGPRSFRHRGRSKAHRGDSRLTETTIPAKIAVRNLTKRFADVGVVAFEGLNFEVAEHEVLCILGPSGCGKTTLLRVIDGLLPPDSGDVLIDG